MSTKRERSSTGDNQDGASDSSPGKDKKITPSKGKEKKRTRTTTGDSGGSQDYVVVDMNVDEQEQDTGTGESNTATDTETSTAVTAEHSDEEMQQAQGTGPQQEPMDTDQQKQTAKLDTLSPNAANVSPSGNKKQQGKTSSPKESLSRTSGESEPEDEALLGGNSSSGNKSTQRRRRPARSPTRLLQSVKTAVVNAYQQAGTLFGGTSPTRAGTSGQSSSQQNQPASGQQPAPTSTLFPAQHAIAPGTSTGVHTVQDDTIPGTSTGITRQPAAKPDSGTGTPQKDGQTAEATVTSPGLATAQGGEQGTSPGTRTRKLTRQERILNATMGGLYKPPSSADDDYVILPSTESEAGTTGAQSTSQCEREPSIDSEGAVTIGSSETGSTTLLQHLATLAGDIQVPDVKQPAQPATGTNSQSNAASVNPADEDSNDSGAVSIDSDGAATVGSSETSEHAVLADQLAQLEREKDGHASSQQASSHQVNSIDCKPETPAVAQIPQVLVTQAAAQHEKPSMDASHYEGTSTDHLSEGTCDAKSADTDDDKQPSKSTCSEDMSIGTDDEIKTDDDMDAKSDAGDEAKKGKDKEEEKASVDSDNTGGEC